MHISKARELHSGDEVFWEDPDHGACSRTLTIATIDIRPGNLIRITDTDGGELECFARELK